MNLKCRYYKSRLTAYVQGELTPKSRKRVAYHLDECPSCYTDYVRQRDLSQQLAARMPHIGQPTAQQLQKMWSGIQADMQPRRSNPRYSNYQARYSFVALLLALVLALPLTLGNRNVPFSVPSQPAPPTAVTETPQNSSLQSPVTVAFVLTDDREQALDVTLRNTPEAHPAQ